ncbi:hypothetical protein FBU59_004169 [Linderina macrospora]|uniref:Uncharacterized protein n=1 Tax=Linderina macrospora TaxID=4868 RepID=A0ACC1J6H5_9FUNG|nr:hypothetical protein FBU59_004169 [Linderina macrospora]
MPTTQAQTHPQTAVASPRTLTQVQMSTAAAIEHRAMTMSGNNAMEATDAIDRQYAVSRSSHGSSSPTSSDEEVGVVKLAKQAATMTLTSGKPEASADPNRKLSDRAANIQKMREVSALGKNMSFGPMHARSGSLGGLSRKSDNDDDNDSVPLGGLKRTGGSTTTTAGQQPGGGACR